MIEKRDGLCLEIFLNNKSGRCAKCSLTERLNRTSAGLEQLQLGENLNLFAASNSRQQQEAFFDSMANHKNMCLFGVHSCGMNTRDEWTIEVCHL
jgi:hypothetical protein